jgi:short subunit dehydrogenase-like uncharacterized protein
LQPRTVCASIVARNGRSIAVLGATGYTGRLIAAELSRHGAALLLAGRNSGKLAQLAEQIGGAETSVTDVRDGSALDSLAQRAQVLINCVGPFVDYGEPVVRAAIAAGAHYLDTTGEQPFVRSVLVHDTWAEAQGVAVVPALAFEVAVADCGAALAAEGFDRVESVRVTYVTRLQASQGTKRSVLRMLQAGGFAYADGQWVEEEPGRQMIFLDLPEPVGRVAAISFPSAEVITIPRHVEASTVRAFLAVPRIAARVLSASGGALGALAARAPRRPFHRRRDGGAERRSPPPRFLPRRRRGARQPARQAGRAAPRPARPRRLRPDRRHRPPGCPSPRRRPCAAPRRARPGAGVQGAGLSRRLASRGSGV